MTTTPPIPQPKENTPPPEPSVLEIGKKLLSKHHKAFEELAK